MSNSKIKITNPLTLVGFGICILAVCLAIYFYSPLLGAEVTYSLRESGFIYGNSDETRPIDTEFGIVIPKLSASSSVISDVDPVNSAEYQQALSRGVAHALGSSKPGLGGRVFLFAHSSNDLSSAIRYNSVFYLLYKLDIGDEIDLYYKGEKYIYTVTAQKKVPASDTAWLADPTKDDLVLMTCWPPGTTLSRLLVIATLR